MSQWYPDFGATHHVTHSSDNFLDSISTSGSDQVMLVNGQGLPITSIGSTSFQSSHKPYITLTLNNLLLVPKITKNLISVNQFARDNQVYFEFHPDICLVKSQATSDILLQGALGKDGLYSFGSLQATSSPSIKNSAPDVHTLTSNSSSLAVLDSCANKSVTPLGSSLYAQ